MSKKISEMTGPELVAAYNAISGKKPIKKFASLSAGQKRLMAARKAVAAGDAPTNTKDKKTAAKEKKPKTAAKKKAPKKSRLMNYAPRKNAEEIKEPRENSKRHKVFELLSRKNGGTIEEAMKVTGWPHRTARACVHHLHYTNGWGLKEDEDGRIKVYS